MKINNNRKDKRLDRCKMHKKYFNKKICEICNIISLLKYKKMLLKIVYQESGEERDKRSIMNI